MPLSRATELKFASKPGTENTEIILSETVKQLALHHSDNAAQSAVFEYLNIKENTPKWLFFLSSGEHLSAYIEAPAYNINARGEIEFRGVEQRIHRENTTTSVKPSFPIYMKRNSENVLTVVGFRRGINFEGSTLRTGLVRYLNVDAGAM